MHRPQNTPLRVLYVHHGSGNGGAPNSLLRLIQCFSHKEVQPVVACDFNRKRTKAFFSGNGFQPIHLPIAIFSHVAAYWLLYTPRGVAKTLRWQLIEQPKSAHAFKKLLKQISPDLVHLNSLTIAPLAPIAKRMGIPVVLHVREPVAKGTFGFRRQWLRRLVRNYTDHVIYICEDNQNRLTGSITHASVLYNPIPFDKFNLTIDVKSTRQELGICESSKVLFFPGGSNLLIKGIFPFLHALSIVCQDQDIYAIIPGINHRASPKNNERMQIEHLISKLGLEKRIIRVPFIKNVEKYYAACDIVLAPFVKPHFSLAVLEAGAMGKPIIGSQIGGIAEVLTDNQNGLLVKPNNPNELATKIIRLIQKRKLAEQLGRNGYSQTHKLSEAKAYAKKIQTIYELLIERLN